MIFIYELNLRESQLFLQIVFLNKLGSHKKMVEKHWPKIRKYFRYPLTRGFLLRQDDLILLLNLKLASSMFILHLTMQSC